jgi:hypothetical protein
MTSAETLTPLFPNDQELPLRTLPVLPLCQKGQICAGATVDDLDHLDHLDPQGM